MNLPDRCEYILLRLLVSFLSNGLSTTNVAVGELALLHRGGGASRSIRVGLNLLHCHFFHLLDFLVTNDIRLVIGHFEWCLRFFSISNSDCQKQSEREKERGNVFKKVFQSMAETENERPWASQRQTRVTRIGALVLQDCSWAGKQDPAATLLPPCYPLILFWNTLSSSHFMFFFLPHTS